MPDEMLAIDGSQGEGGGQILRTSLALSVITGRPIRIENIRAGRDKPGLRRQHQVAVRAAARVGCASVEGDEIGSGRITFRPGGVSAGEHHFDIGSAGSTTLVLQTILPPLMIASAPSVIVLDGGTHNPFAPPFDFLERSFLPVLGRVGPRVGVTLERHGFFPAGGGRMRVDIRPAPVLARLDLLERGPVLARRARALVANLPRHIGEREMETVARELSLEKKWTRVEAVEADGPGNVMFVEIECENVTAVFTGFGRRGVRAEAVARRAAREAAAYLQSGVPVGERLADQLLLPMALAGGGAFRTIEPSSHTKTNAGVIRKFCAVEIDLARQDDGTWVLSAEGEPTGLSKE